jgi:hypothetical protein
MQPGGGQRTGPPQGHAHHLSQRPQANGGGAAHQQHPTMQQHPQQQQQHYQRQGGVPPGSQPVSIPQQAPALRYRCACGLCARVGAAKRAVLS